jgi:hypothetical protein
VPLPSASACEEFHYCYQVGACAESFVTDAGEDRDSGIRIVAGICPCLKQQLVGLGVDGICGLRAGSA